MLLQVLLTKLRLACIHPYLAQVKQNPATAALAAAAAAAVAGADAEAAEAEAAGAGTAARACYS